MYIHEGVSADEDVFMKAKMYIHEGVSADEPVIYEGEDVS